MASRFRAQGLSKRLTKLAFVRKVRRRSKDVASAATDLVKALVGEPLRARPRNVLRRSSVDVRSVEPPGREGHSLGDHLASVVHKRLGQLEQNREFAAAPDPVESLHDLRVASRRLRAFVDVFTPLLEPDSKRRAAKPLKRVTRAVSTLRDLDVQAEHLEARRGAASNDAERALLEHLLEYGAKAREEEVRHTEKHLRRVHFAELRASVLGILGETVAALPPHGAASSELAVALLFPFIEEAKRVCPQSGAAENPEALHRLRIQLKKLRYAVELFEPLLGDSYGECRGRAQRLQEALGSHHDVVVLEELVLRHRLELESRGRTVLLSGLAALQHTLAAERRRFFDEFRAEGFDAEWWGRTLGAALSLQANDVPVLTASVDA